MKRSDVFFKIVVSPVFTVCGCAVKQEQESRGFMGFHAFQSCPNCKVESRGFEFWGENGHRQGQASDRAGMAFWVGHKARHQWRMVDGRLMGYRFVVGRPIFYQGGR
jgi:hypothetical protein